MGTVQKIQQDIKKAIANVECVHIAAQNVHDYVPTAVVQSEFIQIYALLKELAQLLLRLSKVKPTGLYPSSANEENEEEEKPKTTGLTFLEATKDGQMARRPHWISNTYICFDTNIFFDTKEPYADYKLYDWQGEFASWVTSEDYHANDWEIYEEPVTMTGYEAVKLVMEGKIVQRLSEKTTKCGLGEGCHGFNMVKENLEADDWVEVPS